MSARVHVVGGGLAGLAASLALAAAGRPVSLYEAAPELGGRARSYFDRTLGCRIDNGNHLILSGNRATAAHLARIGTGHTLTGPARALYPFADLATGARWQVRPSHGRLPLWVFFPARRVPGTRALDYLALIRLLRARPDGTVADALPKGRLGTHLLAPLAIAILNTPLEAASASLLAAVLRETLGRGGAASVPLWPAEGLSESLVDPAVALLRGQGHTVAAGRRIGRVAVEGGRVVALETPDGPVAVGAGESVVLAVPAQVAPGLLHGLVAPDAFEAIVNLHFRAEPRPGGERFVGVLGGLAEWVFVKPGIISVTISAANRLLGAPAEALAETLWPEARAALGPAAGLPAELPPWRMLREKRATFAATPAQERRRPGARVPGVANLALAGDWTATRLPSTIEGAIRSGNAAAELLLRGA